MIEVLADEWVGNRATAALARAMGVPAAKPHASELHAPLAEVPKLDADVAFAEDYLGAQAVVLGFLGEALAGKVPAVTWTTAPGTVADR